MIGRFGAIARFYLMFCGIALGVGAAIVMPGLISWALARHFGIA
ncbi:hypothetical protein [Nocardioides sp.]